MLIPKDYQPLNNKNMHQRPDTCREFSAIIDWASTHLLTSSALYIAAIDKRPFLLMKLSTTPILWNHCKGTFITMEQ